MPTADTPSTPTIVKVTLLLCASMTVMAGATIVPSLPAMARHFTDPGADFLVRLAVTLPALFIAVTGPLAGAIIDRYGRKPMLLAGICVYMVGGTTGLYVDELSSILIGRAILGVAVGMVMTTTTTMVGDYMTGHERQKYVGTQTSFMALGGVIFIPLGGLLADLHWRGPFAVYLLPVLLLPLAASVLRDVPKSDRSHGDTSDAWIPWSTMAMLMATALLSMLIFYAVPVQVPFMLEAMGVERASLAGMAVASFTLFAGLAALNFGRIRTRFSPPAIFATSFLLMAAGYLLVARGDTYAGIMGGLAVGGFGMGMQMPNVMSWVIAIAPPKVRGRMMGLLTTSIFLGQFLSPFAVQPLADAVGLKAAFQVLAGPAALAGLAYAVMAWRRRRA